MTKYQGKQTSGKRKASARRRRERNRKILILLAVILVIVLIAVGVIVLLTGKSSDGTKEQGAVGSEASAENAEEEKKQRGLQFPYELEDGLEINSLLSSDLMNPDGDNELVEQLASLEVTNTSEQYLNSAQINVTLTDGTEYLFRVKDLPAGGKTIAFSPENATYDDGTPCEAITAETEFADGDQLMTESVSVSADGTTVLLTNLTQEELGPMTVICHDSLDKTECFGGSSYAYQTEAIPAGGSATVEAVDCILGQPTVVRITPEN